MVKTLALLIGVLIAASLLWGVGEMHYRNCVNSAQARTAAQPSAWGPQGDRAALIRGCSRLP